MNIERIHSILLYELTHLICRLKAYGSKLVCVAVCQCFCAYVCVYVLYSMSQALKMHSADKRLNLVNILVPQGSINTLALHR